MNGYIEQEFIKKSNGDTFVNFDFLVTYLSNYKHICTGFGDLSKTSEVNTDNIFSVKSSLFQCLAKWHGHGTDWNITLIVKGY